MIEYRPIVELVNTTRFLEMAMHNEQGAYKTLKEKEAAYEKAKSDYEKAKQLYEHHRLERTTLEQGLYNHAKEVLRREDEQKP